MKSVLAVKVIALGCIYRFTCCRCYDDRRTPSPSQLPVELSIPAAQPQTVPLMPPCLPPNLSLILPSLPVHPYSNYLGHVGNRKLRSTLTSSYITFRLPVKHPTGWQVAPPAYENRRISQFYINYYFFPKLDKEG